ncbi:uncharacterized protein LOC144767270 [Lissotriton helveticus]
MSPAVLAPSPSSFSATPPHTSASTAQLTISPSWPPSPLSFECVLKKQVLDVWNKPITGRLEAIVSSYKLYDSSFATLKPNEWICDEVIDAYLSRLCMRRAECLLMSCTVASSVFSGNYPSSSCRLPIFEKETVLCPTNTGMHWILIVMKPLSKFLFLYDSIVADVASYHHHLLNWSAFLQAIGCKDHDQWELMVESNAKQQDSYNCGVFCMLFAESYLSGYPVPHQEIINAAFLEDYRLFIAMKLMEFSGFNENMTN